MTTHADIIDAYHEVARSEAGQIVLADLQRQFGFATHPMFRGDVNELVHRDGQRAVLAYIGRKLESDPAHYRALSEGE